MMKVAQDAIDYAESRVTIPGFDFRQWVADGCHIENYHKHTAWSNLVQIDSATPYSAFMKKSMDNGCNLLFSGEHGFQGEWLYVYDICRDNPDKLEKTFKFRYSTEAYWVKDRLQPDNANCHMVIVARTYEAMRKLNYILSVANTDGFYYKQRIDLNLLFTLIPEDVYITSACIAGWKYPDAEQLWLKIHEHFGDSFFLEYQAHHTDKQRDLNRKILQMSTKYGIRTIVGLDTHYVDEADKIRRDTLLQRKGKHYDDEDGWFMDFPSSDELFQRMKIQGILSDGEILTAMANTHVFDNGCDDIEISTDFKIPILPEFQNMDYAERSEELRREARSLYTANEPTQTSERANGAAYELGQVIDSGVADYFLTNHKIVKTAVSPEYGGVLTTTSRGSASSYYLSKLFGFTTMDRFSAEVPIFPERFITKERILQSHQMPDIDNNIKDQVPFEKAAKDILGEHCCYPLLAVGKFGEKSGFKMYADIAGIDPETANEISKDIDSYNEAMKQADTDADKAEIHMSDFIEDKTHLKIYEDSHDYRGIIEKPQVHACGFMLFNGDSSHKDVVGYGDIRYEIGLLLCHSEASKKLPTLVACVEGGLLDKYGFVKDDFLIVDVVSIIDKLYHAVGMDVPTVDQLRQMVDGDAETWRVFEKGATCCVNQCEKPGTTAKAMAYKPKTVKELAAFIAGIRPGFKSHIQDFCERKPYTNGEPAIDDLLKDTFNYMIYQEAVMRVFTWLGIPMKDSYDTIKKISKKKLVGEKLAHVEGILKDSWMQKIGNLDNFDAVFKIIKDSARYSFNAPHALAMACDALYEAYIKAHYTSKFYEVTLNHYQEKEDKKKIAALIQEAKQFYGYTLAEYRYGYDNTEFVVDDEKKVIYPNLSSVKNIGKTTADMMWETWMSGATTFYDAYIGAKSRGVGQAVLQNLIKIRYFERFGSIKKVWRMAELIEVYSKRATIPKPFKDAPIEEAELLRFVTDKTPKGNVSEKRYIITDNDGLCRMLCTKMPDMEDFPIQQIVRDQFDILGFSHECDPSLPKNYVLVWDLDTKWSPKFTGYCLNNGKTMTFKIAKKRNPRNSEVKTSFADVPLDNGNVIYLQRSKQKPRLKKVNGEWQEDPNIKDWWAYEYYRIS